MAPRNDEVARDALSAFAEEAVELMRNVELGLNALLTAEEPERTRLFRDILRWLHTLKGAAAVVGQDNAARYVHALEEHMRRLAQGAEPFTHEVAEQISAGLGDVHLSLQGLDEPPVEAGPSEAPPARPSRSAGAELMRFNPEKVDALHALVGDLVISRLQHEALARRMAELRERAFDALGALRSFSAHCTGLRALVPAREWANVAGRLDAVNAALSEVTREMTVLAGDFPVLQAQSAAVSASLLDGIRDLRLMPLQSFLEDFARVVRETARENGKEARLSVEAQGAEVDRAVLLKLRDALSHLCRNAVVHGIEPASMREAMGKHPTGVVRLEGHCEGSRAILRVIDDGAGVDMEAVWRKAVRLGLWSPHEPLPKEALVDLLAQPGFSTRDEADTLAGRGIGLDVVAAAVRDLDGQLSIATEPGAGTVFTIEVPVTASTGLGLLVRVGEHAFGILLNHVERAIRVGREDVRVLESHDTVMIGDAPVAVLPLGCLVGLPESRLPEQKAPALVLRSGKQRLVVTVDDVPGDQALVVKPLGRAFAGASHLGGAAVQPDGTVLPVLSVPALFTIAAGVARPSQAEGPSVAAPRASEAMSVLVADDSLAMRTLLRNILRADGYDVSVAHDGREALGVLASMPRCDLVVTDLQMPHMDGVELCRAVRQSARPHVPVVLVTSVGDAGEKQRALAAGADAYVIKSEFEQARFLSLCARLSGR